jgi:hypothetical protein
MGVAIGGAAVNKSTSKPKLTDAERHKRFAETAKKVEASDKSEDFDMAFDGLRIRNKTFTPKDVRK